MVGHPIRFQIQYPVFPDMYRISGAPLVLAQEWEGRKITRKTVCLTLDCLPAVSKPYSFNISNTCFSFLAFNK